MTAVVHWDDATADDSGGVRVRRMEIGAGELAPLANAHGAEEQIVYALGGSGRASRKPEGCELRAGDCLVCLAADGAPTLAAGADGLDVLVFGMSATPEASEQSLQVVTAGEVALEQRAHGGSSFRDLGRAAGSRRAGLKLTIVEPGGTGPPSHCHSAEAEVFVVLSGEGTLELTPGPRPRDRGAVDEQHAVRRGSVVVRPPATGIAHAFRAGGSGLEYLAYGTREPNDIAYYPRSNKVYLRGVGVIARLEHLDYWEGED